MSDQDQMVYVGRMKDCGCLVAGILDRPELADDIQSDVFDWLGRGLIVERVHSPVRLQLCRCDASAPTRRSTR
jgi:hypothetical protein